MSTSALPPLLIAEDDANDMFLFTRLLTAVGAMNALHIALNGQDALRLLSPVVDKNRLVAKPALAFLDVKMPRLGGLDVLEWIRNQPALDSLPVVMMANTIEPAEVERAAELGAQCYVVKFPGKLTISRLIENAARFTGRHGTTVFDVPDNLLRKRSG
jgi:CheY-like chemotaxis protein